jgi:hypothetical protein
MRGIRVNRRADAAAAIISFALTAVVTAHEPTRSVRKGMGDERRGRLA